MDNLNRAYEFTRPHMMQYNTPPVLVPVFPHAYKTPSVVPTANSYIPSDEATNQRTPREQAQKKWYEQDLRQKQWDFESQQRHSEMQKSPREQAQKQVSKPDWVQSPYQMLKTPGDHLGGSEFINFDNPWLIPDDNDNFFAVYF